MPVGHFHGLIRAQLATDKNQNQLLRLFYQQTALVCGISDSFADHLKTEINKFFSLLT